MPRKTTSTAPHSSELAFRAIIHTYGLIRRVMEPYFSRFGISGAQWGCLRALHRAESAKAPGLLLSDLGQRLLIRPPSVTGAVDRLQRQGLVDRNASSTDLRAKYVSLTPAGRELIGQVLAGHEAQLKMVLGGLNAREQQQLKLLLNRLDEHLAVLAEQQDANDV
jgi:DNA-binding MarR family transcriptional regulator